MVDNVVGYPVLTFFINGQKIYLKGGNWGMSEYLLRCQGKEYETKIRLHKEMNYNMIRLWTVVLLMMSFMIIVINMGLWYGMISGYM